MDQRITFCTTPDGVRLAYATAGDGPALIWVSNWFTHLEANWKSPIFRPLYDGLAEHHLLVRYDVRGTGLSDRNVDGITFDKLVDDLGVVVDAVGLSRFALLGLSQGGQVTIAYAARHPERVTHLILVGSFARGAAHRPDQGPEFVEAIRGIIRQGWGREDPSFRHLFTTQFMPDATSDQQRQFSDLEKLSATPEIADKLVAAAQYADVKPLLGQISAPTLVLHCRGDRRVPYESGRELASLIPGARFVSLESNNHILVEQDPAIETFFSAVADFLGDPKPRKWKRTTRHLDVQLQSATRRLEASTLFKLLGFLAVIATLISFIVWLLT